DQTDGPPYGRGQARGPESHPERHKHHQGRRVATGRRHAGYRRRRAGWRRGWIDGRRAWRRDWCESSATTQGDSEARDGWRQRAGSAARQQGTTALPAPGAPDAHQWHGEAPRHHWQGWLGATACHGFGPSPARAGRAGRCEAVALSANASQRRARGSGYRDRRDFLSGSVVQRTGASVVGLARRSEYAVQYTILLVPASQEPVGN